MVEMADQETVKRPELDNPSQQVTHQTFSRISANTMKDAEGGAKKEPLNVEGGLKRLNDNENYSKRSTVQKPWLLQNQSIKVIFN